MTSDANVALAALVVGLVALLIAGGQLLQQVFGTADGYRRCQRSVIGPWAEKTRLVWRWSQFRFETRFTTPEIVLQGPIERNYDGMRQKEIVHAGCGGKLAPEILSTVNFDHETDADLVSWVPLVKALALLPGQGLNPSTHLHAQLDTVWYHQEEVGIFNREHSWDLMPADMPRPMATSRLGTMIVLALRLGMRWRNLELADGVLRAEGNGHALVSTMMRGYGIVFQYSYNHATQIHPSFQRRALIPRSSNDLLSCGILPGYGKLDIPLMPLKGGDSSEDKMLISSALHVLGVSRVTTKTVVGYFFDVPFKESMGELSSTFNWPIHDMIALLVPFQPLQGVNNTNIAYPLQTDVTGSIFRFRETRRVLLERSKDEVHDRIKFLADTYPKDFACDWNSAIVSRIQDKSSFIRDLQEIYDWTTDYFLTAPLKYTKLVGAHVEIAFTAEAYRRRSVSCGNDDLDQIARIYIRNLPLLSTIFKDHDDNFLQQAWWMLMLRGLVWRMSVFATNREAVVPSRLYYDQTPVYIM